MTYLHLILAGAAAKPGSAGSAWVAPTIVISIIALAVSICTFVLAGRRTRLDRQRQVFGDAMDAVMTYREYPFIVFRRNVDEPTRERQRISTDLSALQARLNGFKGRLNVEDPYVGARFDELLAATRRIVGSMIAEAWNREPAPSDDRVHNPGWDFGELESYDEAFLRAVADHLGGLWAPARRRLREWGIG
ncbi:MAG TPA: hypothetical protein VKR79_07495 [Gaiellaceae bacterium]|nr:hypothetical protein [Gaiellaceae bacterium]